MYRYNVNESFIFCDTIKYEEVNLTVDTSKMFHLDEFNVNGSTSTKTGFNPDWIIGHNEVDQQTVGINTESPDLSLLFLYGLIKHCKANKLADEPEFTIKENLVLIFFEKLFSKFFVCLPIVIFPVFITFIALSKSFFLYGFSNNG